MIYKINSPMTYPKTEYVPDAVAKFVECMLSVHQVGSSNFSRVKLITYILIDTYHYLARHLPLLG